MAKTGLLYVLVHPSHPVLYKVGVTILNPVERLAQHNRNFDEHAGKIVKEAGHLWTRRTYIKPDDSYWAEKTFSGAPHGA